MAKRIAQGHEAREWAPSTAVQAREFPGRHDFSMTPR